MAVSDAMRAVCEAAGWVYCAEHNRPRFHSADSCDLLHPQAVIHSVECIYDPGPDCTCVFGQQTDSADSGTPDIPERRNR